MGFILSLKQVIMNREIKFRFWKKSSNTMLYWNDYIKHGIVDMFENKDLIPLQYTGIRDANNKEIYEGDIISGLIVTYSGNQEEGLGMNCGWYLQRCDFESYIELESRCNYNSDNYKILGNIYENPELI
jgi:uncharacterized phage protein (TIGR01671 family)